MIRCVNNCKQDNLYITREMSPLLLVWYFTDFEGFQPFDLIGAVAVMASEGLAVGAA